MTEPYNFYSWYHLECVLSTQRAPCKVSLRRHSLQRRLLHFTCSLTNFWLFSPQIRRKLTFQMTKPTFYRRFPQKLAFFNAYWKLFLLKYLCRSSFFHTMNFLKPYLSFGDTTVQLLAGAPWNLSQVPRRHLWGIHAHNYRWHDVPSFICLSSDALHFHQFYLNHRSKRVSRVNLATLT